MRFDMHYEFPIIERLEDVLPAVEGRDEFIVAEREGFTVVNYNVGYEDTFTIDENDLMENHGKMIPMGIMRRELRGIIFDAEGKLMSRPFHKFFNVGEREETQLHALDMLRPHVIMEKMDGSMIRPIRVNGEVRLATKMGVTDTSIAAERLMTAELRDNLDIALLAGLTPLFEFIAPDNRIVIEYDREELVLLAIRDNKPGRYLSNKELVGFAKTFGVNVVPMYGSVDGSFADYIARQREAEGREGDIIRFADGHMLKIKNDWYVRIHKVKDKIRTDRHILSLVLENEIDDVMPHLDENDFARVRKYEADFHASFRSKVREIEFAARDAWLAANFSKKTLATVTLPKSEIAKGDWQFVFKYADGKDDFYAMVMDRVRSKLGNTAKYNELAEWLGLDTDQGEAE
jgi:RNA ligase